VPENGAQVGASSGESELRRYLGELGLDTYAHVVIEQQVTSLQLLLDVAADPELKSELVKAVRDSGTGLGPRSAAKRIEEKVTPAGVQAWLNRPAPPAGGDGAAAREEAATRQKQLADAVAQVRQTRKAVEDQVNGVSRAQQQEVAGQLATLRQRLAASDFEPLPSADTLTAELADRLKEYEDRLARVSDSLLELIDTKPMTLRERIVEHGLLRGFGADARGLHRRDYPVLDMPPDPTESRPQDPTDENDYRFRGASTSDSAMHLIETSSQAFAASAEVSGAAFVGSGIGALSVAMHYADAHASDLDTTTESSSTRAAEVQSHYYRVPKRDLNLNTLRLSEEAARSLRAVCDTTDADERRTLVREFLETYGSHVFGVATLGGWYRSTARATGDVEQHKEDRTAASASDTQASVSASAEYQGVGGSASAAASVTNQRSGQSGRRTRDVSTGAASEDSVETKTSGGMEGLPRELWLVSVQHPRTWTVIDRSAPRPVWTMIRDRAGDQLGLTPAAGRELAALVEEVWVQDVFVPSLEDQGALYRAVARAHPTTAAGLYRALKEIAGQIGGTVAVITSAPGGPHRTEPVGGWTGGFDHKSTEPVQRLRVSWDGDKIVGLAWTYFDDRGEPQTVANLGGSHGAEFVFDRDETLVACSIDTVPYGGVPVGSPFAFRFTTTKGRQFVAQCDNFILAMQATIHDLSAEVAGRHLLGFHGGVHSGDNNPFTPAIGLWLSPQDADAPQQPPHVAVANTPIAPADPPQGSRGFQVVVTDGRNPSDPSAVLLNRYFVLPDTVPVWRSEEEGRQLYAEIRDAVQPLAQPSNLLIVASFGMDLQVPPTQDVLSLWRRFGAGNALDAWKRPAPLPPGHENMPCNYILAGYGGSSPGRAAEKFELGTTAQLEATVSPPGTVATT
jgi:hypothetical protein